MMKLNTMRTRLDGLVIFRGILQANIGACVPRHAGRCGERGFCKRCS